MGQMLDRSTFFQWRSWQWGCTNKLNEPILSSFRAFLGPSKVPKALKMGHFVIERTRQKWLKKTHFLQKWS